MCGGFTCSKHALVALNVVYVVVAFLLIGVATYGKTASIITSVNLLGGIVFCGVLLLFVSLLGLVGAYKHHQVMLFFYMLALFLLFLVEFSIACACLAVNADQQEALARSGWKLADNGTKHDAQENFGCCGFENSNNSAVEVPSLRHPVCPKMCCSPTYEQTCCMDELECICSPCYAKLKEAINSAVRVAGGIALFFSFTELIGFVLAYRFRNMMDTERGVQLD